MFWAVVAVVGIMSIASMIFMEPDLLKERLRPGPGGRDKWIVQVMKLLWMASLFVAGFDVGKYHWSDTVPLAGQVAGLIGFGLGMGLLVWSMAVNRFFSTVVRLQADRGHHLVSSGPYRVVRHPGYAGFMVSTLCLGLALGSWLSVLTMLIFNVLILRRTIIEDRFLHENLEGYLSYAARVRYRLIPGIW
jgi:protein-S-isoprenylcysteine O-methyltransferase Ste14